MKFQDKDLKYELYNKNCPIYVIFVFSSLYELIFVGFMCACHKNEQLCIEAIQLYNKYNSKDEENYE